MSRTNIQPHRIHLFLYRLAVLSALIWSASCQHQQEPVGKPENTAPDTPWWATRTKLVATETRTADTALWTHIRHVRTLFCDCLKQQHFSKALELDSVFAPIDYRGTLDSVRVYLIRIDSLEKLNLSPDSLMFFKADALHTICQTDCFTTECSCWDFSLIHSAMNEFLKKYPQSKLADNAEYSNLDYCFEGGAYDDYLLEELARECRQILVRYPDTDLRYAVEYEIWFAHAEHSTQDTLKIKQLGADYLRSFPESDYAKIIRENISRF